MDFHTTLLFFFLLFLCHAKAFNITSLLGQYSSFSNFNDYLTQTQVAAAINARQTITVLVVENSNLSPLSGKSPDVLANIMRVHVLLDYYDVQKLQKLPNKTMKAPTLFQTTGKAVNDQGYLNMTDLGSGSVAIGSAAKGATLGSNLVKSIASQPFNISILQISNVIIPLGIDSTGSPSSSPSHAPASPNEAPTPASAPSSNKTSAPTPSAAAPGSPPESEAPDADTPDASSPAPSSDAPGSAPKADAPSADAPAADAPSADGPAADAPPADKSPSGSSVLGVNIVCVAILNVFLVLVI